jgi:acyl homoserine lactone synthase
MYRLRHQVFNERLHWDVQDFGELEIDQFDYQNPNYILAKDLTEKIIGCWRLIPTSENYMLEEVFDFMLGSQPLPKDEKIWELSRFAVIDTKPVGYALSEATVFMIKEIMDFALKKKITGYLAVTSVGVERLMKFVDIPMERVGNKKAVMIGNVKSVLCLIPVNQQFINSTYRLVNEYAYLGKVA